MARTPLTWFIDYRRGVLASALLIPIFFHPIISELKDILHFNIVYWTALWTFVIYCVHWVARPSIRLVLFNRELYLLYLLPYLVALVRGFSHVDEIPIEVLSTNLGGAITDASTWYISHALGSFLVVTFALVIAGALRTGLSLSRLLFVAAVPLWFISLNLMFVTLTSGHSLKYLADPANRHFLLDVGFGAHGNTLGVLFSPAYALYLGVLRGVRRRIDILFVQTTLGLIGIGILLSFSRAAYLTALVVTLFWMKGTSIKKWIVFLFISVGIMFFLPNAFVDRFLMGVASGDIDLITAHRLSGMWEPLFADLSINPVFGNGFYFSLWSGGISAISGFLLPMSHNAFLDLMLETGTVGLVLVTGYYVYLWVVSRRYAATEEDPLLSGTLNGFSLSVVALLLVNVVGERITPELHHVYFWLGVGVFLSCYQQRKYKNVLAY